MEIFSTDQLIEKLKTIRSMGWVKGSRPGNHGSVGNTIEDILGIEENNLPIPNAAEWELKCSRKNSVSLVTLLHCEPSPKAIKFVPNILLPKYGWSHKQAGVKHPLTEKSFRQTISCLSYSDRGFIVELDKINQKITISFNKNYVGNHHQDWLKSVQKTIGLKQLNPQPYWGFDDIFYKVAAKLHNCFYLLADAKKENGIEFFKYDDIYKCVGVSKNNFLDCIKKGVILLDFDARTGHNHGTKFRIRSGCIPKLYEKVQLL